MWFISVLPLFIRGNQNLLWGQNSEEEAMFVDILKREMDHGSKLFGIFC